MQSFKDHLEAHRHKGDLAEDDINSALKDARRQHKERNKNLKGLLRGEHASVASVPPSSSSPATTAQEPWSGARRSSKDSSGALYFTLSIAKEVDDHLQSLADYLRAPNDAAPTTQASEAQHNVRATRPEVDNLEKPEQATSSPTRGETGALTSTLATADIDENRSRSMLLA